MRRRGAPADPQGAGGSGPTAAVTTRAAPSTRTAYAAAVPSVPKRRSAGSSRRAAADGREGRALPGGVEPGGPGVLGPVDPGALGVARTGGGGRGGAVTASTLGEPRTVGDAEGAAVDIPARGDDGRPYRNGSRRRTPAPTPLT